MWRGRPRVLAPVGIFPWTLEDGGLDRYVAAPSVLAEIYPWKKLWEYARGHLISPTCCFNLCPTVHRVHPQNKSGPSALTLHDAACFCGGRCSGILHLTPALPVS